MEIILLDNVNNLGKMGAKVAVKSGYARNFLVPQGFALPATKDNLVEFEKRRAELERLMAERLAHAQARRDVIHETLVVITTKAGDEGRLFGSIGVMDIVEAMEAKGHKLERSELRMPEGPIRAVGEYQFDIDLGSDVVALIKVAVQSDKVEE